MLQTTRHAWDQHGSNSYIILLSYLPDTKPTLQEPADEHHDDAAVDVKKKRTFRKFSYRGIDLDKLLDLSSEQLMDLVNARPRRRFQRGLKRKPM
ncbi:ribosomal protein S15, partial [Mortierella sp. GBA35]